MENGAPPEPMQMQNKDQSSPVEWDPEWICKWRTTVDEDIALHEAVWDKGYPNHWGAKIPVKSKWNLHRFEELLQNYDDKEVVEWLWYGWPSGRLPTLADPAISSKNHQGAVEFPEALDKYISKEQNHGSIMGPYNKIPFRKKVGRSPLSTRPKKDSQDRRIILDLSFPPSQAVNDGMIKNNYMGLNAKLTFPRWMTLPSGSTHKETIVQCSRLTSAGISDSYPWTRVTTPWLGTLSMVTYTLTKYYPWACAWHLTSLKESQMQ